MRNFSVLEKKREPSIQRNRMVETKEVPKIVRNHGLQINRD